MNTESKLQEISSKAQKINNFITYMITAGFLVAIGCLGYIINQWFVKEVMNPNFPTIYVSLYCGMAFLFFVGWFVYNRLQKKLSQLDYERIMIVRHL